MHSKFATSGSQTRYLVKRTLSSSRSRHIIGSGTSKAAKAVVEKQGDAGSINSLDVCSLSKTLSGTMVSLGASALPAFGVVDQEVVAQITDNAAYVPDEIPEWQLWAGFIGGVSPFVIAAWEFGKRIVIQRQCEVCKGSGLIQRGKLNRLYKCNACGGFLPWQSWDRFFESSPGNGGVLQYPKGQSSVLFNTEAARVASQKLGARSEKETAGRTMEADVCKESTIGSQEKEG